jgi:hypothetical protein
VTVEARWTNRGEIIRPPALFQGKKLTERFVGST